MNLVALPQGEKIEREQQQRSRSTRRIWRGARKRTRAAKRILANLQHQTQRFRLDAMLALAPFLVRRQIVTYLLNEYKLNI